MKTHIYACYLPGSTSPDYIGSHLAEPPTESPCLQWRYANCRYLGQGVWIDTETGAPITFSLKARNTKWGACLFAMTGAQLLAVRTEILEEVEDAHRWTAEAAAVRLHLPPFNTMLKDGPEIRRAKWNAYQRGYRKGYMERNPDKLVAKRIKDKEAAKARRDKAKAEKAAVA